MICQLLIAILFIFSSSGLCLDISSCIKGKDIVLLIEKSSGRIIFTKNEDKSFNPASILKILTSLSAINELGKGYRFKTEFYLDRDGNLKIKGYGDPFLISEIWKEIAERISRKIKEIRNIIIDDSYFEYPIRIPGVGDSLNPYDAPCGALCANFNTINVRIENGRIISAEKQTPLIPFAIELLKKHHIRESGRYVISNDTKIAEIYAARLFEYFLKKCGVKVKGKVRFGYINPNDKLLYRYYSKYSILEVIKRMLEYSNNFIANQIMLVMGAKVYGPPANLDKGVKVLREYTKRLHLRETQIVEGSGISRENITSCHDMAIILRRFMPYMYLLKNKGNIYYKTGTLRGISTRAGYILRNNRTYLFVLFMKGEYPEAEGIIDCLNKNLCR